jgi:hypothetical protein
MLVAVAVLVMALVLTTWVKAVVVMLYILLAHRG